MVKKSFAPRLADILEAVGHIRSVTENVPLDVFEADWLKIWAVTRGVEIISEASRHLPDDLKMRNPDIPWQKIAGIGNKLRHDYQRIAPDVLWKIAREDLAPLAVACEAELLLERGSG